MIIKDLYENKINQDFIYNLCCIFCGNKLIKKQDTFHYDYHCLSCKGNYKYNECSVLFVLDSGQIKFRMISCRILSFTKHYYYCHNVLYSKAHIECGKNMGPVDPQFNFHDAQSFIDMIEMNLLFI